MAGLATIFCVGVRASLGGWPGTSFTTTSPPTISSLSSFTVSGDNDGFSDLIGDCVDDLTRVDLGELSSSFSLSSTARTLPRASRDETPFFICISLIPASTFTGDGSGSFSSMAAQGLWW